MGWSAAGGGTGTVIDLLDREWALLAESAQTAAALRRWRSEDSALAAFGSMTELVSYVESRTVDVVARDEVLGSLGARATVDGTAARALLQLLLPGAKALVARYRWSAESAEELAAVVVADLYDRILALPVGVRRRCLAPAILLDVGKRLQRRTSRARRHEAFRIDDVDPDAAPAYEHGAAALELAELLRWATAQGHLSEAEAELIRLTRIVDLPVAALSATSGEDPQTIRQRRRRAERALAAAARAA
jgi:DNA-directed RNA polymerase specialized sigma24 family protein